MDARTRLGRSGEELAADLYRREGFTIVERNYRCREGEIDVIAQRAGVVVFCEVKTRHSSRWGEPSEAVGFHKQRRLRRLAACWLGERRPRFSEVRFDVVSVVVRDGVPEVVRIPDAF
jgi:putative endonuclease